MPRLQVCIHAETELCALNMQISINEWLQGQWCGSNGFRKKFNSIMVRIAL